MIFDTHSHYDDRAFDEDRERLLLSLEKNGIDNIVCVKQQSGDGTGAPL